MDQGVKPVLQNVSARLSSQPSSLVTRISRRLGQLLVKNGDVREDTLLKALSHQRQAGGLLGQILLERGACTLSAITRALLHQSPLLKKAITRSQDSEAPVPSLKLATNPLRTILILALSDILCMVSAGALSVFIRNTFFQPIDLQLYVELWPALALFIFTFATWHLYPLVALRPAEELRRTTLAISAVCVAFLSATYLFKIDKGYSRAVIVLSWALAVAFVPLGRTFIREFFARKGWWGHPVLVFGAGKTGQMLVRILQRNPGLGLKPVALLDDDVSTHGAVEGVPVIGGLHLAPAIASQLEVQHVLIAMPGVPHKRLLELIEHYGGSFAHLHVIPDLFGLSSLDVPTRDFAGVLGIEVRQQLLLPGPCLVKRIMDLVFTISGGILILPLLLTIAAIIRWDSPGAALYIQKRLGRNGRSFLAWKFRSMHGDGEHRLLEVLAVNPAMKQEYDRYHKLKNDPRITRIGRFLRKYSLDELPQLWNVLRGEMSLVGPRPYLEREIPEMQNKNPIILKSLPGMTGMWQVSGRNRTSFSERIEMDVQYVRNWSPWLDIHILASTLKVVVSGSGS